MKVKKIIMVLLVINIMVFSISSSFYKASANVISKPVVAAAKISMKQNVKKTAVDMANEIVSNYLVEELINSVDTSRIDKGYTPICLDNPTIKKIKDCPTNKQVQIKNKLTESENKKLDDVIGKKIDSMTNTNTKFGKYLDLFIPLFLVSASMVVIQAAIDGEIQAILNEAAQESLIESGLIKPLKFIPEPIEILDFSQYIQNVSIDSNGHLNFITKPNMKINYSYEYSYYGTITPVTVSTMHGNLGFVMSGSFGSTLIGNEWAYYAVVSTPSSICSGYSCLNPAYPQPTNILYQGEPIHSTHFAARDEATAWLTSEYLSRLNSSNVNVAMNALNELINLTPYYNFQWQGIETKIEIPEIPNIQPDYGTQTITRPDNKIDLLGIDAFEFTLPNGNPVQPSQDSPSGFIDSSTGQPVPTNVIDNIAVKPKPDVIPKPETEPDPKPETEFENDLKCDEKLDDIEFERVGVAFTSAFPFSIPFDMRDMLQDVFGSVGDEKPKWNLSFLGDDVVLTVPDLIDNWMPIVRWVILLVFDIALLYLFLSLMRGKVD